MSATAFEDFLVLLYVDAGARARFKANPHAELDRADLTNEERNALIAIDWVNLEMAARSFARKRQTKRLHHKPSFLLRTFRACRMWFARLGNPGGNPGTGNSGLDGTFPATKKSGNRSSRLGV